MDLQSLSNEDLQAIYARQKAPPAPAPTARPLSEMSDEEIIQLHNRPQPMSVAEDVARSAATGAGEGITSSVGMVGDVRSLGDQFGDWVGRQLGLKELTPEQRDYLERGPFNLPNIKPPTTADIESATGFDQVKHVPQTTAGEYTRTAATFATPVGLAGGVKAGVKAGIAGLGSEAAGQYTEGTAAEPFARVLGALATGGVVALLSRPSTAAGVLKKALPPGIKDTDIAAADALMVRAQQQGVTLTWPEALHKVTEGRVDITNLQRLVEQTPGGAQVMAPVMSRRPTEINAANQRAMDSLTSGAKMAEPTRAGLAIQDASESVLRDLNKRVTSITKPYYTLSGPQKIPPAEFARLRNDPLFASALKEVRSNPLYAREIGSYSDDSVGVLNEVKKYLDDLAGRAGHPASPTYAPNTGRVYGGVAEDVRNVATTASKDYERALGLQTDLRKRFLEPAKAGPLGKMSQTDDIAAQGRALLEAAPVEGSQQAVGQTVRLLSRKNPNLAFQLVRTHTKKVFDETTQKLIAGDNQWGGAKFVAEISGNSQQAKNLEAAIRALPDGDVRWKGFYAFLETLEATGRRQRPGSLTAFNAEALQDLKKGGFAVESLRSMRTLGNRLFDFYGQWKLGKNTEELARIVTDPRAASLLRRLANTQSAAERQRLAGLLVFYTAQGIHGASKPVEGQMQ